MLAEKIPEQKMETEYNIPEMLEIETSMLDLAKKMKSELIAGEYDYIISDEKTARIPSLIMKRVMEELYPDKKISILHIAAGRKFYPILEIAAGQSKPIGIDQAQAQEIRDAVQKALRKYVKPNVKNKALVVTEHIHSGNSIRALNQTMAEAEIDFDIAAMESMISEKFVPRGDAKVFIGDIHVDSDNPLIAKAVEYAGVDKGDKYLPFPELYSKTVLAKGKEFTAEQEAILKQAGEFTEDEYGEYVSAQTPERRAELKKQKDQRWSEMYNILQKQSKNISPEDLQKLRQKINQTRQDIKTMAKKIATELKV